MVKSKIGVVIVIQGTTVLSRYTQYYFTISLCRIPFAVCLACSAYDSWFILSIMQIFGTGSVAQVLLSQNKFGDWLSINLSWGFGVTFGCYMAMGISGAHMNPAVTLAMGMVLFTIVSMIIKISCVLQWS